MRGSLLEVVLSIILKSAARNRWVAASACSDPPTRLRELGADFCDRRLVFRPRPEPG